MARTDKRQAFVTEYLIDFNATQAAIRAGYAPRSARQQAARLLTNDDIQAELARRRLHLEQQGLVSVEEVISGLRREATYEDEGASHAARVSAWEKLGKYLGLFADKQEHSGDVTIRIIRE